MENLLREGLLGWLRSGSDLSNALNTIEEESPVRASPPWLGIATSASADWSTKDRAGREVRIALELQTRGDEPGGNAALVTLLEQRVRSMPNRHPKFEIASLSFLRARSERRKRNLRSTLLEYRFRILEIPTE